MKDFESWPHSKIIYVKPRFSWTRRKPSMRYWHAIHTRRTQTNSQTNHQQDISYIEEPWGSQIIDWLTQVIWRNVTFMYPLQEVQARSGTLTCNADHIRKLCPADPLRSKTQSLEIEICHDANFVVTDATSDNKVGFMATRFSLITPSMTTVARVSLLT